MSAPIYLSLIIHNHQPVGQFDWVNAHVTQVCYAPLTDLLERHPGVKCALHFTGSLLDYLTAHQHDLITRLRALVARGQVEILAGGYYEPLLATLPDADKIGQIRKLTDAVEREFGMAPRGMWLAERVWEPHLARPIAEAGIEYVMIDDAHFEAVGFDGNTDLFGYFVTEEQGYTVRVLPSLRHLRMAIPWDSVPNLVHWLRTQAEHHPPHLPPKLGVMGDDGEKFGVWPGTYDHNWGAGQYMETLFTALDEHADWLKTTRPADFIDAFPALGRVYLPTASYFEMGQWSLPPHRFRELQRIKAELESQGRQDILRYLRGGVWRNFMIKYDEVNHMHKRMLMVAAKVHAMPDGPAKEQALDHLWRAQANDAYWHGLFGGVYLFNFRVANYENLIIAEELADGVDAPLHLAATDFNKDSTDEIVLTGTPFNAIWKPQSGGMLLELDYRPARYNLLNLMTRRDEGYHDEVRDGAAHGKFYTPEMGDEGVPFNDHYHIHVHELGLEHHLIVDWHRRGAFLDHFLRDDVAVEGVYGAVYGEQGDFVNLPYDVTALMPGAKECAVTLQRDGHVWVGDTLMPVRVTKTFTFTHGADTFHVAYAVRNLADQPIDVRFAVETASAFDGAQDMDNGHYTVNSATQRHSLRAPLTHEAVTAHTTLSTLRNITFTTRVDQPCALWTFPLDTVTMSEAGYERGYQGTVYLHVWALRLDPDTAWQSSLSQTVTAYK